MKPIILSITIMLYSTCHPTFASQNEPLTLMDSASGTRQVIYENINGHAVVEGDIIIASPEQMSHPGAIIVTGNHKRWPDGIVPYKVNSNTPEKTLSRLLAAMKLWEKRTSVRFIPVTGQTESQYPDHVVFQPVSRDSCASFVGRMGGTQSIILGPNCKKMNIAHELGHALGLWHEQSRIDRDQHIEILWDNIEEGKESNFIQHLSNGYDFGEYDYDSIMHYSAYAFSSNGKKTIRTLKKGTKIGQRKHLSAKDIAAVNAMYSYSSNSQ